ncbi:hypothetical protein QL285_063147 [Trifolium repens]|nr:hypothetical protein QL285_063147 [Trifolium repens]
MAHSEQQVQSPHHSSVHNTTEQQPPTPQPKISTPEPPPESQTSSSELIYGPSYKSLNEEELTLLVDLAFTTQDKILKDAIDIDDEPRLPPNLSKIKIIPLKRKKPEPTIPFDPTKPFFNPLSEPNLELLDIAISLRLKRFKKMDEEVLIFPSDVDSEIREMEHLFSQSLRILGDHVKSKIQGRGIAAVRDLMDIAESSRAPRLTFYNHEEELERLAALDAELKKLSRSACEAAKRIAREEGAYELAAEQAWIAAEQARVAEAEHKRLADQEALNLIVDMAVHIATIETNKIKENQAAEEDVAMLDQNQIGEDNDKGVGEDSDSKKPIVVVTPPCSPMKTDIPSTSSPIPPTVQAALDDIRAELADEIDELRVDVRKDMNSAIGTVHKKMDDMMELLLKAIADVKKP